MLILQATKLVAITCSFRRNDKSLVMWNDDESLNNSTALTREENEMAGDATYTRRATMKQLYNELLCSFISRPM